MRNLRTRLIRAFTLVSLPALLLLAGITFVYARDTYLGLRQTEILRELDNNIRLYYRVNGTLAGLQPQDPPLEERNLARETRTRPPESLPPFLVLDASFHFVQGVSGHPKGEVLPAKQRTRLHEIRENGKTLAYLYGTGTPPTLDAQSQAFLKHLALLLLGTVGVSALLATLLGAAISRRLLQPLRTLHRGVRSLTVGHTHTAPPLPVGSPDELSELLTAFNTMTSELERRRVASRQFSADIAHDLATPLSVMRATLEAMLEGTLGPTPERLTRLHVQTGHLLHLTGDLRLLSLADTGDLTLHCREVNVARLLAEVAAAFEDQADRAGVSLTVRKMEGLPVWLDPVRITQVLHNLMQNALNHTPPGSNVTLEAEVLKDVGWRITVRDTGRGIPPEHLDRIFDRLYRVDAARSAPGSGLGLSIARALVEAHGGSLTVESREGEGTTALLTLPRRHGGVT